VVVTLIVSADVPAARDPKPLQNMRAAAVGEQAIVVPLVVVLIELDEIVVVDAFAVLVLTFFAAVRQMVEVVVLAFCVDVLYTVCKVLSSSVIVIGLGVIVDITEIVGVSLTVEGFGWYIFVAIPTMVLFTVVSLPETLFVLKRVSVDFIVVVLSPRWLVTMIFVVSFTTEVFRLAAGVTVLPSFSVM